MESQLLVGILVGCLASLTMNIGKGIQKMKVHVLKKGKAAFSPENRRDLWIWVIGIMMTGGAGLLFTQAMKMTPNPSIVSSLNGIGLIGLAFFSMLVLKEKVGLREWCAVLMIVVGTGLFQFFNNPEKVGHEYTLSILMYTLAGVIIISAIMIVVANVAKKGQAYVYAAIAGTCLGVMLIFFDLASADENASFLETILSVYFLTGFMIGNCAFVMTNLAFFHASGIVVVPTVNSVLIIVPMILELFLLKVVLAPMQYAGAAVIIFGVILLTTGSGHAVEDDPKLVEAASAT